MKSVQIVACILAVLLLFTACASSVPQNTSPSGPLTTVQTQNIQENMRQTYFELNKEEFDAFYEKYGERFSYENIGLKYIGCYDDCHVAFFSSPLAFYAAVITTEEIGGYQFEYPSGNKLQAYKDGEIILLSEAYEREWITDAGIKSLFSDYRKAS